jgi:predicted DCC family thiol-disulfide oxidoreductase YuxK
VLTLLYDGECSVCRFEVDNLSRLDKAGQLRFKDVTQADFDPALLGKSREELLARIHGVLPTGELLEGMAVFRLAYQTVGYGAWLAPTAWPGFKWLADRAYGSFARNRGDISRCLGPMLEGFMAWRAAKRSAACHDGACDLALGKAMNTATKTGTAKAAQH